MMSPLILPWVVLPVLLGLNVLLGRLLAGPLARAPVHSWAERWLIYWLVGVIGFSWAGTILAGLDMYRWWLILAVLLALAGAVALAQQGREETGSHTITSTPKLVLVVVLAWLAVAAWLFARPASSFLLTDDSAVYTIGGIVLARTGSLFVQPDTFWISSANFARQFAEIDLFGLTARHFGPFYQWMLYQPTLEVGFLPAPKVWTALLYWLFGLNYATWAAPFFGLTGLAALYGLIRRTLSWQAGLGASVLLAVSLPQIWFARYPISEIYAQAFFLGGLYLAVLARQNASSQSLARHLALWSGWSLAVLTILRFEGILLALGLVPLLLPAWGCASLKKEGFARTWLGALLPASSYGTILSVGVARHYFFAQTLSVVTPAMTRLLLGGLLAAGALAWGIWRWRQNVEWLRSTDRLAIWIPVAVGAGWALWCLIAGWLLFTRNWGDTLAGWLAQYWTPSALVLSSAGALYLLWRQARRPDQSELVAWLGMAALFLLVFSIKPFVNPVHPWAMRRLAPVIMPALAVGAAGLVVELSRSLWSWAQGANRRLMGGGVAVAAAVLLLTQAAIIGQRSLPIVFHQEFEGFVGQLQSAAASFPPGAALIFDNGEMGKRLPQSMELIFGHPSLTLYQTPTAEGEPKVDQAIEYALSQGRRVFLIITDGALAWQPERWRLVEQGVRRIDTRVLRAAVGRPPIAQDVAALTLWLDVYEIVPAPEATTPILPLDIPIGPGSYPYLQRGVRGWSFDASGKPIRWTDGNGEILAPWPADPAAPISFCLALKLAGGRPIDGDPARLEVEAEGIPLFAEPLPPGFDAHTVNIPVRSLVNRGQSQLEIRLKSDVWQPDDSGDDLGVLLYQIQMLEYTACTDPTKN